MIFFTYTGQTVLQTRINGNEDFVARKNGWGLVPTEQIPGIDLVLNVIKNSIISVRYDGI